MPQVGRLEKATMTEMWPGSAGGLEKRGLNGDAHFVTVQFNPASLKQTLSNQNANAGQAAGTEAQYAGRGSTKLSFELTFDATRENGARDVRLLTDAIAFFMRPQEVPGQDSASAWAPPSVEFHWGTFVYRGTMDAMEETLDLFSEDGIPLRATVNVGLTKQDLAFDRDAAAAAGAGLGLSLGAGTVPMSLAQAGDTLQQMVSRAGAGDWRTIAQANGIENPRALTPGFAIDLNARSSR